MNKNTTPIYKYRMFVQARADMTPDEQAQYHGKTWPWRDTGEFVFAKRRNNAKAFYREMRKVDPIIKIKAEKVVEKIEGRRGDDNAMRAWRGFAGFEGSINNTADEVRHFASDERARPGLAACGIQFAAWWPSVGKPQCPACLEAAVAKHPEMKVYL